MTETKTWSLYAHVVDNSRCIIYISPMAKSDQGTIILLGKESLNFFLSQEVNIHDLLKIK